MTHFFILLDGTYFSIIVAKCRFDELSADFCDVFDVLKAILRALCRIQAIKIYLSYSGRSSSGSKRSIFNLARYKNQKKCYIEIVERLSVQ